MTAISNSNLDSDKIHSYCNNLGTVKIPRYDGRMSSRDTYHHGDLKAAILAEAAALVGERGADGLSLRELARAAGVSHAAPAHHFTDRRGLFTALATEGFGMLADALAGARPDFLEAALAYVRFAIDHPGHYAVMFDKSLYDADDHLIASPRTRPRARSWRAVSAPSTIHEPRTTHRRPHSRHGLWCTAFQCCGSTRPSTTNRSDRDRPSGSGNALRNLAAIAGTPCARLGIVRRRTA